MMYDVREYVSVEELSIDSVLGLLATINQPHPDSDHAECTIKTSVTELCFSDYKLTLNTPSQRGVIQHDH